MCSNSTYHVTWPDLLPAVSHSAQWYSWGPSHINCRLCHVCWTYWRRYGGLKNTNRAGLYGTITTTTHVPGNIYAPATTAPVGGVGVKLAIPADGRKHQHNCKSKPFKRIYKHTTRVNRTLDRNSISGNTFNILPTPIFAVGIGGVDVLPRFAGSPGFRQPPVNGVVPGVVIPFAGNPCSQNDHHSISNASHLNPLENQRNLQNNYNFSYDRPSLPASQLVNPLLPISLTPISP